MSWKNPGHCTQVTHASKHAAGHRVLISLIAQSSFPLKAPPGGLSLFSLTKCILFRDHPPRVEGAYRPATTNAPGFVVRILWSEPFEDFVVGILWSDGTFTVIRDRVKTTPMVQGWAWRSPKGLCAFMEVEYARRIPTEAD
jgi:hypothetical protein